MKKVIDFGSAGCYEILDRVGHGTYGTVYRCQNDNHEVLAVKGIPIPETGLPALIEASIMATTNSPGLNSCIAVTSGQHNLYLLSELGRGDLSHWTSRFKEDHRPTEEQLRRWSFQLLCGLTCLVRQNIIHGDIKPSNMLLYRNDDVKITDFGLAMMVGLPIDHSLYTYPYRPLEIWALGKLPSLDASHDDMSQESSQIAELELNTEIIRSDIRSDIWALGCSLYEIATGYHLFPVFSRSTPKKEIRHHVVRAIINWHHKPDLRSPRTRHLPPAFLDLLEGMLKVPLSERLTPFELLQSSYFTGMTLEPYSWIRTTARKMISNEEYARTHGWCLKQAQNLEEKFRVHTIDQTIDLYVKTVRLDMPLEVRRHVCFFIAQKLVITFQEPVQPDLDEQVILDGERKMCAFLGFRLHRDLKGGKSLPLPQSPIEDEELCISEIASLKPCEPLIICPISC